MSKTLSTPVSSSLQIQSLARDTIIAIIIRVAGFVLTYLLQICLARWMEEVQYGIYAYVYSLTFLLSILACVGFPYSILRFIPQYQVTEEWGLLRGIARLSWLVNFLFGVGIALIGMGVIWGINFYHTFVYATPLMFGIWLVPLFALILLQQSLARALGDITLSYSPYFIFVPVLALFSAFVLFEIHHGLSGIEVIGVMMVVLLVLILGQLWLIRAKFKQTVEKAEPEYAWKEWFKVTAAMWLITGSGIVLQQTDVIMVGSILGPEDAGVYDVAVKTSLWVSFVLQTVNMVAAPEFSRLYKQNDQQGLQQATSAIAVWIFWPSLIISTTLVLFAPIVLNIFGSEFVGGSRSLQILAIAQLFNSFCSSVGFLMTMTGHQNQASVVYGMAALLNVILNAIAIPLFGIMGAAIATAISIVVWNVWLTLLVIKHVGINPLASASLFPNKTEVETG